MANRHKSTVRAKLFDHEHQIGIIVTYGDEERAVRIDNPFSPLIDKHWHEDHPHFKAV